MSVNQILPPVMGASRSFSITGNPIAAPVISVSKVSSLQQALTGSTSGLLAWWDAERDVYSDTSLTTAITDGGSVAGWRDQGSSGYHVTQSTAGDRPVYRRSVAAFGGKPAVEFALDYLIRTGLSGAVIGNLNTYTVFVVFATSAAATAYMYSEGNTGSATQFAAVRHNIAAVEGFHRSDASVSANPTGGTTANNGAVHLLTLRRIASNSWAVRQDGTQVGTASNAPGTTTINQLAIGALARNTIGLQFTGHIAQVLLFNTDNFSTIEPIIKSYYGIA